jgi:hypothetical protein
MDLLLIVILVLILAGGGWGYRTGIALDGVLGALLLIVVVLVLVGLFTPYHRLLW